MAKKEDRIAKLPVWAQDYIRELQNQSRESNDETIHHPAPESEMITHSSVRRRVTAIYNELSDLMVSMTTGSPSLSQELTIKDLEKLQDEVLRVVARLQREPEIEYCI